MYRRTDLFQLPDDQQTDWESFIDWSVKGGANYNINKNHNVFVNGGYFTRAPYFEFVFLNRTNNFNEDVKHEKVLSTEVGYGYRSGIIKGDLTVYRTVWIDKALTRSLGNNEVANFEGLDATHMGVELAATIRPVEKLDVKVMASVGDWRWNAAVDASVVAEDGSVSTFVINLEDVHVDNAAQTTAALGIDYEILPKFRIGVDYNYYDNIYADFSIESKEDSEDSWQMPSYSLLDFNARYNFKIGGINAILLGNVHNILDTEYIADARDGSGHTASSALVYYGFGRTMSLSLKINF